MLSKIKEQIEEVGKKFRLFRSDFDKVDPKKLNFPESLKKLDELKKEVEGIDAEAAFPFALSSMRGSFKDIENMLEAFRVTEDYRKTNERVFKDGLLEEALNKIKEMLSEVSDVKDDKRMLINDIKEMEKDMEDEKKSLIKNAIIRRVMAKLNNRSK